MNTWRELAIPLVDEACRAGERIGLEGKDLVRFMDREFPWGERAHYPYKVWQEQVRIRLGLAHRGIRRRSRAGRDPGQGTLFPTEEERS